MTLQFRNLTLTPDTPVETWPSEAVLTALERGSLRHWRLLATAIDREPWGRVARRVEQALEVSRPYGVAPLMETVIADARARAMADERVELVRRISGLLTLSGLTQAAFASRIGTSASRFSTYITGKIVPSATMLMRMERVARRASAEAVVRQPEGSAGQARSDKMAPSST